MQLGAITFLWVPGSRRKGDEGGKWDRRGELIGFREKKKHLKFYGKRNTNAHE